VKIQDWYIGYCNVKSNTTSTAHPSATTTTAPAATTTASTTGKRRNGLSKKATIGVAVGASVAMLLLALAIYFPLFKSALYAVRHKIPAPVVEEDREKGVAGSGEVRKDSGSEEETKHGGEKGRRSNEDTTKVHVITAFKQ
jgi:hypothetical protein